MRKTYGLLGGVLLLGACSAAQVQTATDYQSKLTAACGTAMLVAPLVPTVAPWIIGGCSTEEAIAKLATDPTSLTWVEGLIATAPKQ